MIEDAERIEDRDPVRDRRRRHPPRRADDRRGSRPARQKITVIGIPKTIDNDVSFVQKVLRLRDRGRGGAASAPTRAHTEAEAARNGVGLVKLMGRDSGFIAAYSVLVDSQVNFCLVPEVPFRSSVSCCADGAAS